MIYRDYLCTRIDSSTEVAPSFSCNKIIRHTIMDDNKELLFSDTTVSYLQFVDDLATKIALRVHQIEKGQLEVSQAQEFRMFGRADVERWIKNGKLMPCRISPGKKRYKLTDLQQLASVKQNYIL